MKTVAQGWKTVRRELWLSYEDIEKMLLEQGIETAKGRLIEFSTRSPGTTGVRWICLAPSDSVVFSVETVESVDG